MNKLGLLRPKIPVSFGLGTRGKHVGRITQVDHQLLNKKNESLFFIKIIRIFIVSVAEPEP